MTKNEENYEEAVRAINSCFGGGRPNSNIKAIVEDKNCLNLNKEVRFCGDGVCGHKLITPKLIKTWKLA